MKNNIHKKIHHPDYFPAEKDRPSPLTETTRRRVRFEEIDSLGIVWHGRYVSYFEDGRVAFGRKYGMSYSDFISKKIAAPIVKLYLDYLAPLTFDEEFEIVTTLHWSTALRLNFEFMVLGEEEKICATGYSVQLLTDMKGKVLLLAPDWIAEFRQKWLDGYFS